MTDSQTDTCSSDFSATNALPSPNGVPNRANQDGSLSSYYTVSRQWRDVFWLVVFVLHLILVGFVLGVLGFNRFKKKDRLNIDQFTMGFLENQPDLTEDFWPLYALAAGIGTLLGWSWLLLLGSCANGLIKVSVHVLTTYLAVMSVLCFWSKQFFWGVAFATGAALQFLYVVSVIDRLPFTMIVLKGAIKMVRNLPELMGVSYVFMMVLLLWLALWSYGVAGIVALSLGDTSGQWWLLLIFSVSLFWTGAVICNIVHVIVSGMVFLVLIHGGRDAESMPSKPMLNSVRNAVTKSFGSICYGSLFTAAIRTLRWEVRGFRSKIGKNECLLCFADCIFQLVEILVRFFNKYAYVQIAVSGKNFNYSARDAWELFQSTGVEALIAYDCSGAVLLMGTILGGLVVGTCAGVWAKIKFPNRMIMVGSTSMLMGMILVGLAMVVVESAVTSIYICYAEDPLLIHRWDPDFFNNMSETFHQRLQHRSSRATEVFNRFDTEIQQQQQQLSYESLITVCLHHVSMTIAYHSMFIQSLVRFFSHG